jgi:HD-GYP domain-containing protein (c-di-GMP phosphodiesterase class II)
MGGHAERWADSLHASTLFRGAEIRHSDHGLEVSRGQVRAMVLDCARVPDAESVMIALEAGDCGVVLMGSRPPWLTLVPFDQAPLALLPVEADGDQLVLGVHGVLERAELRRHATERIQQLSRYRYERGELVEIARAITRERDIDRLLNLILEKSRYITGADAGSLYVIEGDSKDPANHRLCFKLSQNDSMSYEAKEFSIPVSTRSIAGAAAVTRQPINIADVYELPAEVPYGFDKSFDARMGYRTVSMLTVPMISAEEEVIGVIQLINKKRSPRLKLKEMADFERETIPFDGRSEELLAALAAQAGIALENALLYAEIRTIFEGFVRASVQAIEQRDPTTSGHSQRVSVLSCRLAEAVGRLDAGPYAGTEFSQRDLQELKYAALLHDFGKIGVREQVLVKAKKLYPHERDAVKLRLELALRAAEVELLTGKLRCIEQGGGKSDLDALQARYDEVRAKLLDAWGVIERANEPSVLREGDFSRINELTAITFLDPEGAERRLLNDTEAIALKITRGSLSPSEIEEIRSHVVHTYNFLTQIPWGRTMERIPIIAGAHHEKIDGTGYPSGTGATVIPVQSKIMTVADIYDALTAADRPYKKALPVERALDILGHEVKDGHIDPELYRVFCEAEIYRQVDQALAY